MHFFRDCGVSFVLESSWMTYTLRAHARYLPALTKKIAIFLRRRPNWPTYNLSPSSLYMDCLLMGHYAPRVRVKICGLTRTGDAIAAAEAGADAIGLVFYGPSPRAVSVARAKAICAVLPPFVSRVALFVNESVERVRDILAKVPVDTVQFHGDETPQYCASFGLPYIKSIGVKPGVAVAEEMARFEAASGVLLDSHDRVRWGGTGRAFDWALIPGEQHRSIILAGGLHAGNVEAAIRTVRPHAVDVSGGVERAKGIKDAALIAAFLRGVNRVTAFE